MRGSLLCAPAPAIPPWSLSFLLYRCGNRLRGDRWLVQGPTARKWGNWLWVMWPFWPPWYCWFQYLETCSGSVAKESVNAGMRWPHLCPCGQSLDGLALDCPPYILGGLGSCFCLRHFSLLKFLGRTLLGLVAVAPLQPNSWMHVYLFETSRVLTQARLGEAFRSDPGFKPISCEVKSQLFCQSALRSWASYLSSLSLIFPFCKIGNE